MAALSAVAVAAPPFVYGSASLAAAIVAGALALLAAIAMPVVRPAPGAHAAMH